MKNKSSIDNKKNIKFVKAGRGKPTPNHEDFTNTVEQTPTGRRYDAFQQPSIDTKVLDKFCQYVSSNWNASLGYNNDESVLKHVASEYEWLLEALELTPEQFAEYYAGYDWWEK